MDFVTLVVAPAVFGVLVAVFLRRHLASAATVSFLLLLAGMTAIVAAVGVVSAFALDPWIESTVTACQADPAMYDCADARIVFVFPLISAASVIAGWLGGAVSFRFLFPRAATSKA